MDKSDDTSHSAIVSALLAAKDNGKALSIRYHGGSQPGAARQIYPLSISGDMVRAQCVTSQAVKLFSVSRMELIDGPIPPDMQIWQRPARREVTFVTLAEVREHFRDQLESWGWTLLTGDTEIALHRRFKNGKLRKEADVVLCFETEYLAEAWIDVDGSEHQELKKRARPWLIVGKGGRFLRAYSDVDKATDLFIEQARLQAPELKANP